MKKQEEIILPGSLLTIASSSQMRGSDSNLVT